MSPQWSTALLPPPPLSEYLTAGVADGKAVLVDHQDLEARQLERGRWQPFGSGAWTEQHSMAWHINVAVAEDALWVLADGGLYRSARGQRFECIASASKAGGPSPHFAHRTAMVWDEVGRRLVVSGGIEDGTTWVFERGAWRKIRSEAAPPRGIARAVSTPAGVYLASGRELWLLREDTWTLILREKHWPAGNRRVGGSAFKLLCHRDTLIAVGATTKGAAEVSVLEGDAFRAVAGLPAELDVEGYGGTGVYPLEVGLDPAGDRLLLFQTLAIKSGRRSIMALPLGGVVTRGSLPTRALPAAATPRASPPPANVAQALAITLTGPAPATTLAVGVAPPAGWSIRAVIPASAPHLPLAGRAGLVVMIADKEVPTASTTRAVLLPSGAPPAAVIDATEWHGGLQHVALAPFADVEESAQFDYDLDAGEGSFQGSKIGGFGPSGRPCTVCRSATRFAAQFSATLVPELGDGTLRVFVCPNGCEAATDSEFH